MSANVNDPTNSMPVYQALGKPTGMTAAGTVTKTDTKLFAVLVTKAAAASTTLTIKDGAGAVTFAVIDLTVVGSYPFNCNSANGFQFILSAAANVTVTTAP